jgi:Na+/H+ antiporter NhaD/arsenite permease-like protein
MSHASSDVASERPSPLHRRGAALTANAICVVGCLLLGGLALAGALDGHHAPIPPAPPPGWIIGTAPFVLILLAIASLPLVPALAHWWHQNRNKLLVSVLLSAATLVYLAIARDAHATTAAAAHAIVDEFVPFMALLFSLYVVTGGIAVEGDLLAQPRTTTAFLAFGALIASVVGTTGASMLLIRPLLSTISERRYRVHTVVFFIFIVSNIGGLLLPIGDPPLFMGFLAGVPFFWTLGLWKPWLVCVVILLAVYYIIDRLLWAREPLSTTIADASRRTPLRISGTLNLLWLALIVLAVAFVDPSKPMPIVGWTPFPFLREIILLGLAGLSLLLTARSTREANRFNFGAILEVAAIFIGIFVAMQVPLQVLQARGGELGLTTPGQFFWLSGLLSSFLDNAPTYLVFLGIATALPETGAATIHLVGNAHVEESLLIAISLGSVLMGANTYIGNGPNFMVKSIAEENGVRMPSFFGYMLWSGAILIPLFALVHLLFLA